MKYIIRNKTFRTEDDFTQFVKLLELGTFSNREGYIVPLKIVSDESVFLEKYFENISDINAIKHAKETKAKVLLRGVGHEDDTPAYVWDPVRRLYNNFSKVYTSKRQFQRERIKRLLKAALPYCDEGQRKVLEVMIKEI